MESDYLLQFSFFIVFALLGTIFSIRLRQPYVVGLLVFGMLAGPSFLGLVTSQDLILAFSELGAILLLFTVGIEFSVTRILKSGLRAIFITTLKMSVLFIVAYESALYLGIDVATSFYIGAMLSITSTALLFKIVGDKGMGKSQVLPLLFSMLIVEDVFAVAALTFFSSLEAASPNYEDRIISVLVSLGLLGLFYVAARKPFAHAITRLTSTLNQDVMILVSFSLCLLLSVLAGFLGLSPAIGAFLAGSIISSLPNAKPIEKTLKPLLLLFASLFFLSLGMRVDAASALEHLNDALALVAVFTITCFAAVFSLLYLTGAKPKNALFGASAMVVLGEFSLIIASQAPGAAGNFLIAIGSIGVIATAIVSSLLLDRQEGLFSFFERSVPYGIRFAGGSLAIYFSGLIRDFSPNGRLWRVSNVCWDCMRRDIGKMAVVGVCVALARLAVGMAGIPQPEAGHVRMAILLLGALPMLYYAISIVRDLSPVLDAVSRAIARHKKSANAENRILIDAGAILVMMFMMLNVHDAVAYLRLPEFFNYFDDVLIIALAAFVWDLARNAGKLREI
jgi:CPA2 family monovalent cation:H+ antiporter-2